LLQIPLAAKLTVLALAVVVAALGAAAYVPGLVGFPNGGVGVTTSTTSTSCTSGTWTQGATTTVSGSFNSTQESQVRVDYVKAYVYPGQTQTNGSIGPRAIQFEVGYTNVGSSDIYVVRGCGSSLNSTIVAGNDVIRRTTVIRCLCAEGPSPVSPGQSSSQADPGCWSGFSYDLVSPGTFTAKLVLSWSDSQMGPMNSDVVVLATFTVS
jgi:hypothetical protein